MAQEQPELLIPIRWQLKHYEVDPWMLKNQAPPLPPKTPAEWFSKKWPKPASDYGCPFLETTCTDEYGFQTTNPIALNELFFASILSDDRLGHKVVFYTHDEQFYFRDVRENGAFKPTTEAKLRILISRYLLSCAEELVDSTPLFNLFVRFRKEEELQKVVNAAKSLLAVDRSFFGLDSPYARAEGVEAHGKAARTFIQVFIEMNSQKSLTVTDSYTSFREYCMKNGLVMVDRRLFEDLVAELIYKEFGLRLRHDVPNLLGKQQRGWRGVGLREIEPEPALAMAN